MRSGDSLYEVARRFGVSVSALQSVNGLSGSNLRVGQKLVIPATAKVQPSSDDASSGETYRVRRGDTLSSIASRFGTTISTMKRINGLKSNRLKVGQRIKLP